MSTAAPPSHDDPAHHDPASHHHTATRPRATLAAISLIVMLGYAAVRTWWQVVGPPSAPVAPGGTADLVLLAGWPAVALLLIGATVAAMLPRLPRLEVGTGRMLAALASALGALMIGTAALLLLDVVAFLFPGIGVERFPVGVISRAAMAGSGALLLLGVRTQWRRASGACHRCGTRPGTEALRPTRSPRWAYLAAYLTVLGCLTRLGAQFAVGLDRNPLAGSPMTVAFEVGFLLAGVLLPLALVHGWGRIWPFWVPVLSGRRIPRWLVLGPGMGVGVGMIAYFGMMITQMVADRLQGLNPFPPSDGIDLPETFFWVAVPAYVVWGIGLTVAARSYAMITRPACRGCGG